MKKFTAFLMTVLVLALCMSLAAPVYAATASVHYYPDYSEADRVIPGDGLDVDGNGPASPQTGDMSTVPYVAAALLGVASVTCISMARKSRKA